MIYMILNVIYPLYHLTNQNLPYNSYLQIKKKLDFDHRLESTDLFFNKEFKICYIIMFEF